MRSIWGEFGAEFETIISNVKRDSEELSQIAIAAHLVSAAEFQKGIIQTCYQALISVQLNWKHTK